MKFETVNVKAIKESFVEMEKLEAICDAAELEYDADCENEEKELAFDKAYKASFAANENLVKLLCGFGENDPKVWRKVLATKRNEIKNLINKLEA